MQIAPFDAVTVKLFTRDEYFESSGTQSTIKPVLVDQVALTPVSVGRAIAAGVGVGVGVAAYAEVAVNPATARPITTDLIRVIFICVLFITRLKLGKIYVLIFP